MEQIRIISKYIVRPEKLHGETLDRIELSPGDLKSLLTSSIQKGIFFPKPTTLQEKELFANNVVEHLKTSLTRVLEYFYPLSGRLCMIKHEDDTLSFFIDCNNKGVYFIYAVVDNIKAKDILEPVHTPQIVQSLFPMNRLRNIEGDSNPLLAVQLNELVDGFFIGVTMNHSVGDGSSFWHFLNSWSEISRGSNTSRLPVFQRWLPDEINFPIHIPLSVSLVREGESNVPPLIERVFHFPKDIITNLKTKANTEMNTTNLSSLQALLAHLWQSVIRCQKLDCDVRVIFFLVVGARPRMHDLIDQNYFGNATTACLLITKAGNLINDGLGKIASQMHQEIAKTTRDAITRDTLNWTKNPKIKEVCDMPPNILCTSSSPRFNVYGTDFGWGRPMAVRSGPGDKSDGMITLFPGVEEGSIDIEVCLLPEKLNALENDVQFMETSVYVMFSSCELRSFYLVLVWPCQIH